MVLSRPVFRGSPDSISQRSVAPEQCPLKCTPLRVCPHASLGSLLRGQPGSSPTLFTLWLQSSALAQRPRLGRHSSPNLGVSSVTIPCICSPFLIFLLRVQVAATQGTGTAALWGWGCHGAQPLFAKVNDSLNCSRKAQRRLGSAIPGAWRAWREREQSPYCQVISPYSTQCPSSV